MADPIIPGAVRAQLVLNGSSGLPEDRFVQTFVFGSIDGGSPSNTELDTIAEALDAYLTVVPTGASNALHDFLGEQVVSPATINLYRLGETPPRTPIVYSVPHDTGTGALPAEVALCLSYYATVNQPRRRGRIYFGPLAAEGLVFSGSAVGGDARPAAALRTSLLLSGALLRDFDTGLYPWAVLHARDGNGPAATPALRPITDLWVDDSFDTQRRRGLAPTLRSTNP